MTGRWLTAWGLTAVALGGASLVVPLYVVELGGDALTLGLLFASASLVGVPGALVFGGLADRTGRRREFVLGAMAAAAVTMAAMPLFERRSAVVVANAVLWLGYAAAVPVLTLLVVADAPEDRWAPLIARLNQYQGIGWAGGLALGVVVVAVGGQFLAPVDAQRAFFFACAGCATVGCLLGARSLPADVDRGAEVSPRRLRRRVQDATRLGVRGAAVPFAPGRFDPRQLAPRRFAERFTPALAWYFVAVLVVFTGFGVFFAPLPAYLAGLGYDDGDVFLLYLLLNVGAAAAYGAAATLSDRYGLVETHLGGLAVRALAFPAVAALGGLFADSAVGITGLGVVFFVVGLTWAVVAVTTATLVTGFAPASVRGEALGAYGALAALGGGMGGLIGGVLARLGYDVTFAVAGAVVLVGAGLVALLARRSEAPASTDREAADRVPE